MCRLSSSICPTASWYSRAVRVRLRVISALLAMVAIGVQSSCAASAVSCRYATNRRFGIPS